QKQIEIRRSHIAVLIEVGVGASRQHRVTERNQAELQMSEIGLIRIAILVEIRQVALDCDRDRQREGTVSRAWICDHDRSVVSTGRQPGYRVGYRKGRGII